VFAIVDPFDHPLMSVLMISRGQQFEEENQTIRNVFPHDRSPSLPHVVEDPGMNLLFQPLDVLQWIIA